MKININTTLSFILIFICTVSCSQQEKEFPSKAITMIVPWAAGGGTDGLARAISGEASKIFNVPVNVNNRAGGSGTVGHSAGSQARQDGYTVTMITYELVTYKPLNIANIGVENFQPVMQMNEDPGAITVHAESPWKTLQEFIEHAKANPGSVTVGNSGPRAVWHIGAVKLEEVAGVKFSHIPNDGAKPAVTQLLGKHINAVAVSPAEVQQYVQMGTLRCLGIMAEERDPAMPDVPTFKEQGVDLVHGTWRGLAVPKGTPPEIVDKLTEGFHQAYQSTEFQQVARNALLGLKYRDHEEFEKFLESEQQSVAALADELNL